MKKNTKKQTAFKIKKLSIFSRTRNLNVIKWALNNKSLVLVFIIFLFELFFATYNLNIKTPFGYDQVDNAWAAKNLIVNHQWPLVGMVAKTDSNVYIGPAYYYFVAFFYWIFNLSPVASQAISIVSNIFTFLALFYVLKKLFSIQLAVIALLINTFNFNILISNGVQWPVQLLPAVSLIIFYLLYKVLLGEVKKLIPLAIFIGIAFNLHFTAIFFPIIVILSLPFFPRNKETLKYIFISLPFFLIWLVPNLIYMFVNKSSNSQASSYFSTYFIGFHLRRMFQITGDALIQFDPYLSLDWLKPFKILILPVFFIFYHFKSLTSEHKKFLYLVFLWFMVPWLIFTTYGGEISDYYFIVNKFLVLVILSYFIYLVWNIRFIAVKAFVIVFFVLYCYTNTVNFLPHIDTGSFYKRETTAIKAVEQGKRIEFQVGVPESYLYWYYMRTIKGVEVYVSKNR